MKHGKGSKKESSPKKGQTKGSGKAQKKAAPAKETRVPAPAPQVPVRRADGKGRVPPPGGFSNPVIGNAFKRAIKKYSAALKRLTD